MLLRSPNRLLVALACLLAFLVAPPTADARPQAADFAKVIDGALDSVYMLGISRRSATGPETFQFVGTGWVIAPGTLATNAHVAEALLEGAPSGRLVAKRSWSDRDELILSVPSIRIHPAYGPWNARLKRVVVRSEGDPSAARSVEFIPVADVAIIEVELGTTAKPLAIADVTQVEPFLSEPVVYLGFPHENISGFPTLHAVPGHITAKTDFFFLRAPWAESFLIHYTGAVVGGASGSPMLNRAGQVIGLISAGENTISAHGERTSFGFAYGQRIDLCAELLRDDYLAVQEQRDLLWSDRIADLLMPPDELLEQLATSQALADGLPRLEAVNTVTRREVVVKQGEGASLSVTLEPGQRYGFLAAAHDGTDVDSQVVLRDADLLLAQDVQTDYFPVLWVGPFDERTAVEFHLSAAERLLRETVCSLHVYKYEPQLVVDMPVDEADSASFLEVEHTIESDAGYVASWQFEVAAGAALWLAASSADGFDIDLSATLDGVVVGSDEMGDAFPLVMYTAEHDGLLEVRLRVPTGATPGAVVQMNCTAMFGPQPVFVGSSSSSSGAAPVDPADAMTDDEMLAMATRVAENAWLAFGQSNPNLISEGFLDDFETNHDFAVTLGAGEAVLLVGVSASGVDIDAVALQGDEVLVSNTDSDAWPFVSLRNESEEPVDVVLRLREYRSDLGAGRTYYRIEAAKL
jgi:hypothetical protein